MQANSDVEKWVEDTLRLKGFDYGGKEEQVFLLLRHLLCAVAMYDQMDAYNRKIADVYQKKFKNVFESKFIVKQRRKSLKEKKIPPTPPFKVKDSQQKEDEKTPPPAKQILDVSLEERREKFRKECQAYSGAYDDKMLESFFKYYAEASRKTGRMRFERYDYWDLGMRLARWMTNKYASEDAAAAIRLEETKKRKSKTQAAAPAEEQKKASAEREAENLKREQEHEENKKKAVSYEQWLSSLTTARKPP